MMAPKMQPSIIILKGTLGYMAVKGATLTNPRAHGVFVKRTVLKGKEYIHTNIHIHCIPVVFSIS